MHPRPIEATAGKLDQPRLDHHAAAAKRGVAIAQLQYPPDARTPTDAGAVENAAG